MKNEKIKVVTFFGENKIDFVAHIYLRLLDVIEKLIIKETDKFVIGAKGDFCALAIKACDLFRETYYGYEIQRVVETFSPIVDVIDGTKVMNYYKDVSYFIINEKSEYAKNRKMIDMSDIVVVCYDFSKQNHVAADVCSYAIAQDKTIIDVYSSKPRIINAQQTS